MTEGIRAHDKCSKQEARERAIELMKMVGIPAPESSHAIAAAIREAKACKETGEEKVILFNLSGHGLIDMASYDKYLAGDLVNYTLNDEDIQKNLDDLSARTGARRARTGGAQAGCPARYRQTGNGKTAARKSASGTLPRCLRGRPVCACTSRSRTENRRRAFP